jgi:hypothetical protein
MVYWIVIAVLLIVILAFVWANGEGVWGLVLFIIVASFLGRLIFHLVFGAAVAP